MQADQKSHHHRNYWSEETGQVNGSFGSQAVMFRRKTFHYRLKCAEVFVGQHVQVV